MEISPWPSLSSDLREELTAVARRHIREVRQRPESDGAISEASTEGHTGFLLAPLHCCSSGLFFL